MTDYEALGRILMKWCFESKDYEFACILYNYFGVCVPVKLLYRLPDKKVVKYSEDLLLNFPKEVRDGYLCELIGMTKRGRYGKYGGEYGYVKKK